MLRIDRNEKKLIRLEARTLPDQGITEAYDLQKMIRNSPDAFFREMGEKLLLVGEEVRPATFVDDRIDLLAVDQQGSLVVIELKRGSHKLQLLQALAYAGMVSQWEHEQIVAQRQKFVSLAEEEAEEEIEQFLLEDVANLNDTQRIILIAEDFEYEVLVTAEWLTEMYGLDVRCHRIALSVQDDMEFLSCTCIYPPPEITEHARQRGRAAGTKKVKWADWEEALSQINNEALVKFLRSELSAGRENYLRNRTLYYRFDGRRRFLLATRKGSAYVRQYRRFPDDEDYWKSKIGPHVDTEPVKDEKCLRFHLSKREDFEAFLDAINGHLRTVKFFEDEAGDEEENDDDA